LLTNNFKKLAHGLHSIGRTTTKTTVTTQRQQQEQKAVEDVR